MSLSTTTTGKNMCVSLPFSLCLQGLCFLCVFCLSVSVSQSRAPEPLIFPSNQASKLTCAWMDGWMDDLQPYLPSPPNPAVKRGRMMDTYIHTYMYKLYIYISIPDFEGAMNALMDAEHVHAHHHHHHHHHHDDGHRLLLFSA